MIDYSMTIKENIQIPVKCYSFAYLENYSDLEHTNSVILSNLQYPHHFNIDDEIEFTMNYNHDVHLFLNEIEHNEPSRFKIHDIITDMENSIFISTTYLNKLWLSEGDELYISKKNH